MAVKPSRSAKKSLYDKKLCSLLSQYTQILIVHADNVGSNQLQNIRKGLRGDSLVLMGKNTMMKRSIKIHADSTGNEAAGTSFLFWWYDFFFFKYKNICLWICLIGEKVCGKRKMRWVFGYMTWVLRKWIEEEEKSLLY